VSPRARGSIADTAGQYCSRLPALTPRPHRFLWPSLYRRLVTVRSRRMPVPPRLRALNPGERGSESRGTEARSAIAYFAEDTPVLRGEMVSTSARGAGARSGRREQYCQAVSAVLPRAREGYRPTRTRRGVMPYFFSVAPVRIASPLNVVCAAFKPSRKSLSLNVAKTSVG